MAKTISAQEIKAYLRIVLDLEANMVVLNRHALFLRSKIRSLHDTPSEPEKPTEPAKKDDQHFNWVVFSVAFLLSLLLSMMVRYLRFQRKAALLAGSISETNAYGFFVFIIIFFAFFSFFFSMYGFYLFAIKRKKNRKASRAKEDHAAENKPADPQIGKAWESELSATDDLSKQTQKALAAYYGIGILDAKRRDIMSVKRLYDVFASGKCSRLEGTDGAYGLIDGDASSNREVSAVNVASIRIVSAIRVDPQTQELVFDESETVDDQALRLDHESDKMSQAQQDGSERQSAFQTYQKDLTDKTMQYQKVMGRFV